MTEPRAEYAVEPDIDHILARLQHLAERSTRNHSSEYPGLPPMMCINAFDVLELCVEIRRLRAEKEAHG